ncbi:MAG: DUF3047 domain-containing protein [bacterium]
MKMRYVLLASFILALTSSLLSQETTMRLLGDFEKSWEDSWIERKLAGPPARFEVVMEDSNSVLQVETNRSSSALWYPLSIKIGESAKISWRWKVDDALSKKTAEREKMGEDFAARVFVIFEPHLVNWRTRAICYVWSANQKIGTIYRSPYSSSVGIVVLESGNSNRGEWVSEERNFVKDYRKIFGKFPEIVTGAAIMVDTDNTNQKALTWFDDVELEVPKPEKKLDPEKQAAKENQDASL